MTSERPTTYPDNPRLIVGTVCAVMLFGVLNASLVNVVLPELLEALSADAGRGGWVVSAYLLTYGVTIPILGRIADRTGARTLFLSGIVLFTIGSTLCALAPSLGSMIAARVVQALGGAAFPGLGLALASGAVPPEKRGVVLGAASATIGIGAAVGPLLGGVLAAAVHWRAVFAMSALVLCLYPVAARYLPVEERVEGTRVDAVGGGALAVLVVCLLYGFTTGGQSGWSSPSVLVSLSLALACLGVLVRSQRESDSPFIPRELIGSTDYRRLVSLSFLAAVAMLGTLMAFPLMLSAANGLDPLAIGVAMLPGAVATAVFGMTAGRIVDWLGAEIPIRVGWAVMLVGMLLLVTNAGRAPWALAAMLAVTTTGFAFFNTPLAAVISVLVGPSTLASALSFNTMVFFVGGSMGASAVSSVLTAETATRGIVDVPFFGPAPLFSAAFLTITLALLCAPPLLRADFRRTQQKGVDHELFRRERTQEHPGSGL